MRIENINILNERFPILRKILKEYEEEQHKSRFLIEIAKNGLPTVSMEHADKRVYLHSKYDPVQEAERLVDQLQDVRDYQHVFFYGVGLGYHIESFMKRYPELKFTLYEPQLEMLSLYLDHKSLQALPVKKLNYIYAETSEAVMDILIKDFTDFIDEKVLFVSLPSYERVFGEHFKSFIQTFRNILILKQTNLNVSYSFEKRWILNSLVNFDQVLATPNIMGKKAYFQGRPAVLVSAGPSLTEDFESIRHIKENGLAYIFTVGSAVNALFNQGIIPDAAFAHDPSHLCINAFQKIIDEDGDTFPLVFGSSIGFEVTQKYRGPKLHMIISQDTIAPFLLKDNHGNEPPILSDAPTIALATLELLSRLGCEPIILAGQNLGFMNDRLYANGISYTHISSEFTDDMRKDAFLVEDIYGGQMYTNRMFNNMRLQMEAFIQEHPEVKVINTTKGGAKIDGADFIPIENLILNEMRLSTVDPKWYLKDYPEYDFGYANSQYQRLALSRNEMETRIQRMLELIKAMVKLMKQHNEEQLVVKMEQFDKELKRILKNDYYMVILRMMERVNLEIIAKKLNEIKYENDIYQKSKRVIEHFGKLFVHFKKDMEFIDPIFIAIGKVIHSYVHKGQSNTEGDRVDIKRAVEAIELSSRDRNE